MAAYTEFCICIHGLGDEAIHSKPLCCTLYFKWSHYIPVREDKPVCLSDNKHIVKLLSKLEIFIFRFNTGRVTLLKK